MAELGRNQNYLSRDYQSIRADLINLLKVYYPDQFQDFNSASIGMSLVELLAYVSDILSYNTDKRFNELFLDGVTERTAVFRLAKTFGYNPVGFRPAMTIADIEIQVPPTADGPDLSYLPVFRPGVQLKGSGQVFETVNECDFSSDFSEDGVANRKILPVFNSNQDILRYRIIKRERIKAGVTVIYKKEISSEEASTPFLEVFLPEKNVLEIISVICKPAIGLTTPPNFTDFNNLEIRFFEVDDLAQKQVFVDDDTQPIFDGIRTGKYIDAPQRFIKEFMADGSCKLTFGGGTADYDAYESYLANIAIDDDSIQISDIFNNNALGVKLPANSTLYIQYRIGGGVLSNVGANILQQVGNIDAVFVGNNSSIQQSVLTSTRATNPLPGIGGADLQTVDEIKYLIASNFSAQKRCVTLEDYISRAYQLPGKYGTPFRIYGKVEDNKVKLYILTKDANGKVSTRSPNIIKNNLVEYLVPYRMINDFVEVNDGKVIDIQIEVDIFIDKTYNSNEVKVNVINMIKDFMNVDKWQMNQHIYISQIVDAIREIPGIINVVDIRFYNMEGGIYSNTVISQATGQRTNILNTGVRRTQIEPISNAIFSTPMSMFQIRQPETDILVRTS
jgi:hypothetical protein